MVALLVVIFLFFKSDEGSIEIMTEPISGSEQIANATVNETKPIVEPTQSKTVFVEIKGSVIKPGVYELPNDGRVKNVIELAQPRENADLKTINQAEKLKDEMVIYVPKRGEKIEEHISNSAPSEEKEITTVNVNTANTKELTTLNGIGEKKAQAIVEYREEKGLFMKVEDLLDIPGIGEKTLENLRPYISIGD